MAAEKILLVEGTDDEHVVRHLWNHHGFPSDTFEIKNCQGVNQLLETFPVQLKGSGVNVVGVLADANNDTQGRWDSLQNHLEKAMYQHVPTTPVTGGFISPPSKGSSLPRVGIWLMPDNSAGGALEDFLYNLAPQSNQLLNHAQSSINTIPKGHRLFADKDNQKALLRTWLAWQENPGRPFGTAIKAKYLNGSAPDATAFVNWLRKLFT